MAAIRPTLVDGNFLWGAVPANGFGQKPLGRLLIPSGGEEEVNRLARFIDCPIQIHPLPLETKWS